MNELERALHKAILSEGDQKDANKAYLEFIKANFIIPIQKSSKQDQPEVLFFEEDGKQFLPVFTNRNYLDMWASEIQNDIQLLELSGVNLLKGVGDHVIISLNIGTPLYKEFNPSELARMRSLIIKFFPD